MRTFKLVKITDTSGKNTGEIDKVFYYALTEDEYFDLLDIESSNGYIGWDFKSELFGEVFVPSAESADDRSN